LSTFHPLSVDEINLNPDPNKSLTGAQNLIGLRMWFCFLRQSFTVTSVLWWNGPFWREKNTMGKLC